MKKSIQLLLYLVIFLALHGCSKNREYLNPEQFYSLTDTLKGEILSTPLDTYADLYYTEYGIFACTRLDNKIFQLLDSTNAAIITSAGRKGRGPNEFLMALAMQYDYLTNQFSVFDLYRQDMVTYLVSPDSISLIKSVNLKRDLQRVKYINDSLLAFINFYPNQKMGLINTNAEVIYEEEYNTLDDERIITANRYYSIKVEVSPNKKYTVVADSKFTSIKVYLNKPNILELKWKKMLFEPKYNINSSKEWYILRNEHYFGFRYLYLTNKYIYLNCDDTQVIDVQQKVPDTKHTYILVLDYEGNIINKYLLDKLVTFFTISQDEKFLYAEIEDPDILIAKYTL